MSSDQSRREILGRRGALLVQFGLDITGYSADTALDQTRETVEDVRPEIGENWERVAVRVRGVEERLGEVDAAIQKVSSRWKISRMGVVDRSLLRIGAWEVFESEIPPVVTIDACVELAKEFGGESTSGFVNGLLDELCDNEGIAIA